LSAVGILGGTFNPPHLGHLAVARCAREELSLERVLLMPVHTPPHKPAGSDPGAEHRLAMCVLLAAAEPGVEACGLEVARRGPSYTADTLGSIHAGHPEAELTFIVGADTARTLGSWREPRTVMSLARVAVATRAGAEHGEVDEVLAAIASEPAPAPSKGVCFLNMPPIDISSSIARERAARGEPLDDLLGADVASYVREHELYRETAGARA
jgi:nicotinate-nucleotide adenylyltransferase